MNSSMEPHCLSFRDIPQTSKLFLSFFEDFSKVARYYSHPPTIAGVTASAKEVKIDPHVRQGVVAILREQNQRFAGGPNLDKEIARNLDRLAKDSEILSMRERCCKDYRPDKSIALPYRHVALKLPL